MHTITTDLAVSDSEHVKADSHWSGQQLTRKDSKMPTRDTLRQCCQILMPWIPYQDQI